MLLCTDGRISEILVRGEYFGSLLIKKRIRGIIQPIVFDIKGDVFRSLKNQTEYQEGDKIRIWFVPICRKHNDRYYTNLAVEKVQMLEKGKNNLFRQGADLVDTETGEVFE